jgi:hypothetical protein
MDADIWAFMASHGMDLQKSGSAERGFSKSETLELLQRLQELNMKPLGLEIWHLRKDGRFEMDSLAGWAPINLANVPALFVEAREIVESTGIRGQTVFTIQF